MSPLPLTRDEAWKLIKKHNSHPSSLNHYLESEAVMRALAEKLKEDVEYWGMLGLLHDVDWELTQDDRRIHLSKAPKLLREAEFDDAFIQIVLSHGYGCDCAGLENEKRTKKVEHALAAAETITGLIFAYAILRGGITGMEVKGLKKRFKSPAFAAKVNRDVIRECEKLGLELNEFFQLSIDAIASIKDKIGLK